MTSGAVRPVLVVLLGAAVSSSCGGGGRSAQSRPREDPGNAGSPLPTSQSSISPQVANVVAALREQLHPAGLRLDLLTQPYHPSEPAALRNARRTIFSTGLPQPADGYVVIYEFAEAATAASMGRQFAEYLGSGFGQTNYPLDAQFSLAQVGGTLVFTWWSRERSSDPERAGTAFRAISQVGQRIEVRK